MIPACSRAEIIEAGVSPAPLNDLEPVADNVPLAPSFFFPIRVKLDTIAAVRGLYRKERTDHGRQRALLHYSSAYTYSYALLIPARPRAPFFPGSARVSRAVSASRQTIFPVATPPYHRCRRREVHDSLVYAVQQSISRAWFGGETDSCRSMLRPPRSCFALTRAAARKQAD